MKEPTVKDFESILDDSSIDYCGEPVECSFIAGQHIDAGSVTVSNDEEYLYVKVYSKAGFQDVSENIKMWIGQEAPSRRPPSGDFPYKVTETGDTHIFKILLSDLPEWDECGKQYDIIVHGDVLTEEGNSESGETAYGGCELTGDKPWWAYMEYETQCCEEEGPLGWLFKNTRTDEFVTCMNDSGEFGFSNQFHYDWFNLENYDATYPINIEVGDDCETFGVTVGSVELDIVSTDLGDNLKLKIITNSGYEIENYSIYIGWTNPVSEGNLDDAVTYDFKNYSTPVGEFEYLSPVSDWEGTNPGGDGPPFYVIVKLDLITE